MAALTVTRLESLESQTSFLEMLNENLEAIADVVNSKFSLDDSDYSQLEVNVDVNSKRIMNLGSPESSTDAARWMDVYSAGILTEYAVPNPAGNGGKYLSTDGTTLFWSSSIAGLLPANNLSDLVNATTARQNLGLGTSAVYDVGGTGSRVPLLSTAAVWSAAQTWNAAGTFTYGGAFTGSREWRVQTTGLTSLSADSVGYRGAPPTIKDANYTFVLDDAGRSYLHSSGSAHAWTIPPDADVLFPDGTIIVVDNYGAGNVTITRGSGVNLRENGSGTSANYVLPQYTVRSLFKQGANFWVVL